MRDVKKSSAQKRTKRAVCGHELAVPATGLGPSPTHPPRRLCVCVRVRRRLQSLSVFAAGSAIDMLSCSLTIQAALGRDDGLSSACAAACCMAGHQQEQLAGAVKELVVQYGELRLVSGAFTVQLEVEYHADVAPLLEQFVRLRRECLFHAEQAMHHAAADSERAQEYEAKMADFQ